MSYPSDWNLTVNDLIEQMKAGKRAALSQPELDWAREYERLLIPEDFRFPNDGDVYESLIDQPVEFLVAWHGPFTTGGNGTLMKGERVRISSSAEDEKPIGVNALAVEHKRLEERMVPKEDRDDPKYGGFYFVFKTVELNKNFRLVETKPGRAD
jgi:hypothetical protein